jgi:rifampicin phosphotransferase
MLNYTKILSDLNKDSLQEAGGKGANLGVLINAGLPVPPGFIVTASAYRAHLEASRLQDRITARLENIKEQDITAISDASNDISAWIEEAPMPIDVQDGVERAYDSLSKKTRPDAQLSVAVRSSATAEDLPSASFAGQHETFLGIYGKKAVLNHVKKCWASLWSSQAISYRMSMRFEHLQVDLAVVVQAMIDSECAGVMFTANPINGNRDEILISAGYGLGEAVVSGLITPDTFILTKGGSIKEKVLGSKELKIKLTKKSTITEEVPQSKRKSYCLGADELEQLANLANLVEKHYGRPMDTEWALSKGKIYLLQGRPITTMKSGTEELNILGPEDGIIYQGKKPPFGMQMAMEYFPEPLTPLDFSIISQRYRSFNMILHDLGLRLPKEQIRLVERESGCVAISIFRAGLSPAMIWKAPAFLIKNYFKDARDAWQPLSEEMNAWLTRMEASERDTSDAEKSAQLIKQALDEFGMLFYERFLTFLIPTVITDIKLSRLVKKAMGKENAAEIKENLLRGLPFRTALQNKAMVKMAQAAAVHGKDSPVFREEFNRFMEEYGDRPSLSVTPLLGTHTMREKPEIIHKLIDTLLCDTTLQNSEESFNNQAAGYEAAKKQIEKRLKPGAYLQFQKVLERARNEVIVREESSFFMEKLTACMRRMALKLGSLLAENSVMNEAEDVFFIFLEELDPAAGGTLDIKERIEKRRKSFAKVYAAHEKGVHWMISTGSYPVFEAKKKKKEDGKAASDSIQGSAASSGVYEGAVCIVKSPSEFNKLKKGDVLVSTYTSPAWTPLFRVASAVVTERGSAISHAAIVAREYGIPAVVAIDNVTNILRDGQRIRVDGTKGTVTLLK